METLPFESMAYLQNGSCFATAAQAKADFISRVVGIQERGEALRFLETLSEPQLRQMFPTCAMPIETFNGVFVSMMELVVLCLVIRTIRETFKL